MKIAEGLLIAGINLSSPVADSGIKDGEVIIKAGQYKSKSFADLDRAIAEAKAGGKKSVLLMVTNGKTARFVGLPIE